jgi:thiol:disulfide interchange protein
MIELYYCATVFTRCCDRVLCVIGGHIAWVLCVALIALLTTAAEPLAQASEVDAAPILQPSTDLARSTTSEVDEPLPAEQAFRMDIRADNAAQITVRWKMPKGYYLYRDRTTFIADDDTGVLGPPQWPQGMTHKDPQFGDVVVYYDQVDVPIAVRANHTSTRRLTVRARFQGCLENSVCYPPMTREIAVSMPSADAAGASFAARQSVPTLFVALAAALLGGLVLNLMPCVLPVLSLKAIALVNSAEGAIDSRRRALYYTAGVMVSFATIGLTVLTFRAAGHALGWGFQLQQPWLVGLLVYVMLSVGLSLSGVIQFGLGLTGLGGTIANRGAGAGDFFTGVLACVVAAPCTAPFMGSALAFALSAPVAMALCIFLALGLGLSLPFLLIGFFPALQRWLPRPGAWMEALKQVLAFPMYLTGVWLLWVLGKQRGVDAMAMVLLGSVTLTLGLWWFERHRNAHPLQRVLAVSLAALALIPLFAASASPTSALATARDNGSVQYTADTLQALRRANTPVFVDVSADWCITCKVNEAAVLSGDAFHQLLQRTGTAYMVADYTDVSPEVAAFLDRYHAVGVPLYVVFPRDGGEGRSLPTLLTSEIVRAAIEGAVR